MTVDPLQPYSDCSKATTVTKIVPPRSRSMGFAKHPKQIQTCRGNHPTHTTPQGVKGGNHQSPHPNHTTPQGGGKQPHNHTTPHHRGGRGKQPTTTPHHRGGGWGGTIGGGGGGGTAEPGSYMYACICLINMLYVCVYMYICIYVCE